MFVLWRFKTTTPPLTSANAGPLCFRAGRLATASDAELGEDAGDYVNQQKVPQAFVATGASGWWVRPGRTLRTPRHTFRNGPVRAMMVHAETGREQLIAGGGVDHGSGA